MKQLIRQNPVYFISLSILLIFGGAILVLSDKEFVTLWVNQRYSRVSDIIILCTDNVGTVWFNVFVVAGLWLYKGWKTALQGAVCFLMTVCVVAFFKHVLFPGELRPILYFEKDVLRLVEGVIQLETESIPSGHTAAAFAIAGMLSFTIRRKSIQWIFALLAATVGYGRIYLSQHFVSDVYIGMIIGVMVSTTSFLLMDKIFRTDG